MFSSGITVVAVAAPEVVVGGTVALAFICEADC